MRWIGGLGMLLAVAAVSGAELSGQLRVFAGGKALRDSEAAEAVLYFRPDVPTAVAPLAEISVMTTRRKQFVPRVLAIPTGSSVRFPNEDPILHNAFSTSADNAFDTGQYGRGEGRTETFTRPGLVRVYCNVHHAMFGFIVVLDTPHFTKPDAAGRFLLRDLPEGGGELVVFHDRGAPMKQRVVLKAGAQTLDLSLDLNKRRVPNHMNKFGKPYARTPNVHY